MAVAELWQFVNVICTVGASVGVDWLAGGAAAVLPIDQSRAKVDRLITTLFDRADSDRLCLCVFILGPFCDSSCVWMVQR